MNLAQMWLWTSTIEWMFRLFSGKDYICLRTFGICRMVHHIALQHVQTHFGAFVLLSIYQLMY